jgi:CDP-glycerol glycerophosphotransferase (TagB/SpsB family)
MITDHSSIGFEYLLLDRPLIRIAMPELVGRADVGKEYVDLIAAAATTVETARQAVEAVGDATSAPARLSAARRAVAAELFHAPGDATGRAVRELYALMDMDVPVETGAPVYAVSAPVERALSQ